MKNNERTRTEKMTRGEQETLITRANTIAQSWLDNGLGDGASMLFARIDLAYAEWKSRTVGTWSRELARTVSAL